MNEPRTFLIDKPERLTHFTTFLAKQDLPLDVTVAPYIPKRTQKANRRLWALHTLAAGVTGYSPEDMHEFALCRHFGFSEQKIGDIVRRVPLQRSSQRNKKVFGEFMEATESWYACDFGVWLGKDDQ